MLADLKGKVVVVNIGPRGAGRAIAEEPGLAQLSKRYGDSGAVRRRGHRRPATPARAFIQKYGWTYPSVADPKGRSNADTGSLDSRTHSSTTPPGKRVWAGAGKVETADLQAAIDKGLASAPAS